MTKLKANNVKFTRSVGTVRLSSNPVYTTNNLIRTIENPNPAGAPSDFFGRHVSVNGTRALFGSPLEDSAGQSDSGAAFVVDLTTGNVLNTFVDPVAPNPNDRFGGSVAFTDNYIAIGAEYADSFQGKVWIYDATTYNLLFTLTPPGTFIPNHRFGSNIHASGSTLVVGTFHSAETSQSVFVYDMSTGNLIHTLTNPDDNPSISGTSDQFGEDLYTDGTYVIAGAKGEDVTQTDSGRAYVYEVSTGNLIRTIANPTPVASDYFGSGVAVYQNYAIVGAEQYGNTGETSEGIIYVFDITTGNLVHTINNPNPNNDGVKDQFGAKSRIRPSQGYLLAGANATIDTQREGMAYLFDLNTGSLVTTFNNPNAYSTGLNDSFGFSVGISGSYVVCGAPGEDSGGTSGTGIAYVFSLS